MAKTKSEQEFIELLKQVKPKDRAKVLREIRAIVQPTRQNYPVTPYQFFSAASKRRR